MTTMGNDQNKTVLIGMSNNHILGYEDGVGWEVELDASLGTEVVGTSGVLPCSIFTNPVNILQNHNEWPSGSARFL